MNHSHSDHRWKRHSAGRYVEAFSWSNEQEDFLRSVIIEAPLLHVCSGPVSDFGDVRVDRYVTPAGGGVIADWKFLPFCSGSFAAVFADPPWNIGQMQECSQFCDEATRIAPVVYVMAPWLWVKVGVKRGRIWVREFPGVNIPVLLVRYERDQMRLF